jgi:hypothetical protein
LDGELNSEQYREATLKSETAIAQSRKRIAELEASISALEFNPGERQDGANGMINIKRAIYDNVHLTIGRTTEVMKEMKDGARSIIENSVTGGLRVLPSMASLTVNALDIESALISPEQH